MLSWICLFHSAMSKKAEDRSPLISDVCVICWIINCILRCSTLYLSRMVSWDVYLLVVSSILYCCTVHAVKLNTVKSQQLGNCRDLSQLVHQHNLNTVLKMHTHIYSVAQHTVLVHVLLVRNRSRICMSYRDINDKAVIIFLASLLLVFLDNVWKTVDL